MGGGRGGADCLDGRTLWPWDGKNERINVPVCYLFSVAGWPAGRIHLLRIHAQSVPESNHVCGVCVCGVSVSVV